MLQPECQFGLLRSHDEVTCTMYASSYQLVIKKHGAESSASLVCFSGLKIDAGYMLNVKTYMWMCIQMYMYF